MKVKKKKLTADQITIIAGHGGQEMRVGQSGASHDSHGSSPGFQATGRSAETQSTPSSPQQSAPVRTKPVQRRSSGTGEKHVPAFLRDREKTQKEISREMPEGMPSRRRGPTQEDRDNAIRQPIAKKIMDVFDARLMDVYPAQPDSTNPTNPTDPKNSANQTSHSEASDSSEPAGDEGRTNDVI